MWISRLNRHATHLELEGNRWEVLGWSYQSHLPSNVPHRHTYFEACLVGAHGAGIFTNESERHELEPGSFFLARPGAVHQIVNTGDEEMELFWVSFAITQTAKGELGALLRAFVKSDLVLLPGQEALTAMWRALLALTGKPGSESGSDVIGLRLQAQSVLLEIAHVGATGPQPEVSSELNLSNAISPPLSGHVGLARLGTQYVHDNLERSLTPDEIARHLAVSRRQLTRLFSAYTGVPPALYIEKTRIDRARGLLRAGQKSVKEVANSVGYPDVHHFTRVFTRVVGTSPARYRLGGAPLIVKEPGQQVQNAGPLV